MAHNNNNGKTYVCLYKSILLIAKKCIRKKSSIKILFNFHPLQADY